ncbi:MAG: alkaline phosphatase family protein [Gemmatimonadaceae bacterium]
MLAGCGNWPARVPASVPPPERRAILVSFDAFNERRVTETIAAARIPAILALFSEGSCVAAARPAFPSVTAAGHAALWTGAFGNRSGIAANTVLRLPASQHSILETANGFSAAALRSEPLWIAAALDQRAVFAHHVTQAPGIPGYPTDDGEPADTFEVARRRAQQALTSRRLAVLNGYNAVLVAPALLTAADVQLTVATRWRGLSQGSGAPALEFDLPLSGDPLVRGRALHALLRLWPQGDSVQFFVSPERDLTTAIRVWPHAEERAPVRGRALARYFSEPVVLRLADGRRASMRLRLFALRARDTSFTLYVPGMQLADANRDDLTSEYDAAVPGWVGNSAVSLWERGRFGRTLAQGGDGVAERRWMESAELLTRGFVAGSAWGWRAQSPQLMLDYFPLGDDIDHALWGYLDRASPRFDVAVAQRAAALRAEMWELVDLRLAGLMELVRSSPNARLFVGGDHGMRPAWRRFRPNAALREAGLLSLDSAGHIDLARSRAASANGYWISVNRERRRGGIVAPADEGRVMDDVRRALLSVRDEWGRSVVTQVSDVRSPDASALGIGGVTGGDVYYDLAPGYLWTGGAVGPVVEDAPRPTGEHGFPSTSPDMHTVSCAWGPTLPAQRDPEVQPLTELSRAVRRWLNLSDILGQPSNK